MSNYHAAFDSDQLSAPTMDGLREGIRAIRRAIGAVPAAIAAAFGRRLMQRRIERFPAHLLRDVGFERDWDGSIRPLSGSDSDGR